MSILDFVSYLHRPARVRPKRRRLRMRRPAPSPFSFIDGETIRYLGHSYRLRITRDDSIPQGCGIWPHRFEVNIHGAAMSDANLRQEVRLEILLWAKKRARAKFQKRMEYWAGKLGVNYRQMIISDPRTLWGTCNSKNIIRLNWRLILAPLPLLDYVVAHELCHVTHKNHAPAFWGFLATVMPDYKERRQHLRRIGLSLNL
jgi:predicted metal-dependent hydrolase